MEMSLSYLLELARLSATAVLFGLLLMVAFRIIVLIVEGLAEEETHGDD
jgi:hypothetical protein